MYINEGHQVTLVNSMLHEPNRPPRQHRMQVRCLQPILDLSTYVPTYLIVLQQEKQQQSKIKANGCHVVLPVVKRQLNFMSRLSTFCLTSSTRNS